MSEPTLINKISDRVKLSIQILRKNPLPFFFIALAYSAIEMALMKSLAPMLATHSIKMALSSTFIFAALEVIFFEFVRIIFITGFIGMTLLLVYEQPVTLSDFTKLITKKKLLRILGAEAVIIPVMIAGFALLILPGLVWFVLTIFSYIIIIKDDNVKVLDSVSKSISLTAGVRTELFTICIVYGILSFVSSLIPVLSLIVDTVLTPMLYVIILVMFKERASV